MNTIFYLGPWEGPTIITDENYSIIENPIIKFV